MTPPAPKPIDRNTAVLVLNMGGPQTLADVRPFLRELFDDRDIIQLPLQPLLAPLIVKARAGAVSRAYATIGGGSPILEWTRKQLAGLVERLSTPSAAPGGYIAFRYTPPFTADAVREIVASGVDQVIVLTLYPHYARATTGSSVRELQHCIAQAIGESPEAESIDWWLIDRWGSHPGYLETIVESIREGLRLFPEEVRDTVHIIFSAHSLPLAQVDAGDPYPREVLHTIESVAKLANLKQPWSHAFQSAVGPIRWMGPSLPTRMQSVREAGATHVLVVPTGFSCDHIETLYELDVLAAEDARNLGFAQFERAPAPNDTSVFLDALRDIIQAGVSNSQAVDIRPLMPLADHDGEHSQSTQ